MGQWQQAIFGLTAEDMVHKNNQLPPGVCEFENLGLIGAGGLGEVYKIRIERSNWVTKPVGSVWALKKLNAQWKDNPTMRVRFDREIEILKTMAHPNIVPFEGENLSDGDERFYAMPLYTSNVRNFVAEGGKRGDWRFMAGLGITLANALHYAHTHEREFVHRDLKPENILFNPGKPLVIADWGLGYFVHQHSKVLQKLTNGRMGTEYYCSFEQWSTGKCDARGDIYSLAMTLDEMVTGRQRQIQVAGLGINGPCTADTSAGGRKFNQLLMEMTMFHPHERPSSMSEVAGRLREALDAG